MLKRVLSLEMLTTAVLALIACGDSNPVTPPAVSNTPPMIDSVTIAGQRAEANRDIQVTAVVRDTETPVAQLTYTWSATPANGTFTGTGASATWKPPLGQKSPDIYTITLTVSESYTSAGQARVNTVSASTTVHYNDSTAETIAIANQFIKDFGTYEVSASECVRNFSETGKCGEGKDEEEEQIEANRENFHILSAQLNNPSATFNGNMTEGEVLGACVFEDVPKSGPNAGRRQRVTGTCQLTTVYENFRWYLCASHFLPPFNSTLLDLRGGRVPGRIPLN